METKPIFKYKKEGFAAQSVGAVVTLIVGVGVSVLVLIFVGTLSGQTYNVAQDDLDEVGNNTATNEAFTPTNGTLTYLDHNNIHSGSLFIENSTGDSINLNNFTVDYTEGTLNLTDTSSNYSDTSMTANYSWGDIDIQTSLKNSITSGFGALEDTGDYLPLIVLAVVITLVMALVLSLGNMGGTRGGSAL